MDLPNNMQWWGPDVMWPIVFVIGACCGRWTQCLFLLLRESLKRNSTLIWKVKLSLNLESEFGETTQVSVFTLDALVHNSVSSSVWNPQTVTHLKASMKQKMDLTFTLRTTEAQNRTSHSAFSVKPPWIPSSRRLCISKGSTSGRAVFFFFFFRAKGSVSISAAVRMCVNGFSPRSLSEGKGTQSAAGRLLTPTPPGLTAFPSDSRA